MLHIFHPSDSEISDCLSHHRAVCAPARVRRAGGAESAEESVLNGRQLSHQGRVMRPPPLSPPALCAAPAALGTENGAQPWLPASDGSVPATARQSVPEDSSKALHKDKDE